MFAVYLFTGCVLKFRPCGPRPWRVTSSALALGSGTSFSVDSNSLCWSRSIVLKAKCLDLLISLASPLTCSICLCILHTILIFLIVSWYAWLKLHCCAGIMDNWCVLLSTLSAHNFLWIIFLRSFMNVVLLTGTFMYTVMFLFFICLSWYECAMPPSPDHTWKSDHFGSMFLVFFFWFNWGLDWLFSKYITSVHVKCRPLTKPDDNQISEIVRDFIFLHVIMCKRETSNCMEDSKIVKNALMSQWKWKQKTHFQSSCQSQQLNNLQSIMSLRWLQFRTALLINHQVLRETQLWWSCPEQFHLTHLPQHLHGCFKHTYAREDLKVTWRVMSFNPTSSAGNKAMAGISPCLWPEESVRIAWPSCLNADSFLMCHHNLHLPGTWLWWILAKLSKGRFLVDSPTCLYSTDVEVKGSSPTAPQQIVWLYLTPLLRGGSVTLSSSLMNQQAHQT